MCACTLSKNTAATQHACTSDTSTPGLSQTWCHTVDRSHPVQGQQKSCPSH